MWEMTGDALFTGGRVIMDYGLIFELKTSYVDLFQLLSSPDVNWWTGVGGLLWCFYQLFGLSFWRHPFTSIAETLMQWHITLHVFNQKKKNSTFCTWWSAVITICNISFCFLSQSKFIGQKRWFFRGICFGNIKINTKRHLQPIITWHVS